MCSEPSKDYKHETRNDCVHQSTSILSVIFLGGKDICILEKSFFHYRHSIHCHRTACRRLSYFKTACSITGYIRKNAAFLQQCANVNGTGTEENFKRYIPSLPEQLCTPSRINIAQKVLDEVNHEYSSIKVRYTKGKSYRRYLNCTTASSAQQWSTFISMLIPV